MDTQIEEKKYVKQLGKTVFHYRMSSFEERQQMDKVMTNLYGWITTDSLGLKSYYDTVGCDNRPNCKQFEEFFQNVLNTANILRLTVLAVNEEHHFNGYNPAFCDGAAEEMHLEPCEKKHVDEELIDLSVRITADPLFTSLSEEELYKEAVNKGITVTLEEWRKAYSTLKQLVPE